MSVQEGVKYAKTVMWGTHRPSHRWPNLEVVGLWYAYNETTGDASGGFVSMPLSPLPQAVDLPYLPKLDAYFSITGIDLAQNANKALGFQFIMYADFPALTTPNTVNSVLSGDVFQTGAGDGYYHANIPYGWSNWLGKRLMPGGTGSLKVYIETNTNGQGYYFQAQGLLLKTPQQLRNEGLW